MWTKKQRGNITSWTPFKQEVLSPINDLSACIDLYNEDDDRYSFYYGRQDIFVEHKDGKYPRLPSGVYRYEVIGQEYMLIDFELTMKDTILDLKVNQDIINDFQHFKNSRSIYEELSMPFKRGILLYGPPGTGKTMTLHKIIESVKNEDMVVIFCVGKCVSSTYVKALKEDTRLKMFIFEEFTNALRPDFESDLDLLDFLDGETSLNNMFIVGSTNYPEKLPMNITNRSGRFDKFYELGYLTVDDIKNYLQYYGIEADKKILTEKQLTIAQLKEIVLLIRRDNKTISEALQSIKDGVELARSKFKPKLDDDEMRDNLL